MEERDSSSSPKTVLDAKESEEFRKAKEELFIYLYRKRPNPYFKRWRRKTREYFNAVDKADGPSIEKLDGKVKDTIDKYAKRIKHRREKFKKECSLAVSKKGTIPYLNGIDVLEFPKDRVHRRELIEKEKEYHRENQRINPDTRIPDEMPVSDNESASGNVSDGSLDAEWKSEAGTDTES